MDQDLVVRVQQGDQQAFEMLATADHSRLYRVAYGVMGDHALAEDVTQQALLDIWRSICAACVTRRSSRAGPTGCWCGSVTRRARRRPKWVSS